ncbi:MULTISPECIES: hypothetical protein [unclassified Bradyrhizobium]|uniref:hypothetical protein n=1 Tax=unclassified Bradyrhizobium TaxID=2631580 RepID=UPI0013EE897E|nr:MULTISPECIES: hypothetical protein [unclassified Bradyrhizobium]MCA1498102.1 hypothetical protein [Bradyrhizobium sp. NBAIM14]
MLYVVLAILAVVLVMALIKGSLLFLFKTKLGWLIILVLLYAALMPPVVPH